MRISTSKNGSALVISMIIMVIITLLAVYLLDRIIPFSKNIRGVENGNIAYYRAESAIDEALLFMSGSNPGYETWSSTVHDGSGYILQVTASGKLIPQKGKWLSEYDPDWNRIAPGEPIQLILPKNINDWNGIVLKFRVPDLNHDGNSGDETLSGSSSTPIINWLVTGSGVSIFSDSSQIMASSVYRSLESGTMKDVSLGSRNGMTLTGLSQTLSSFYSANCVIFPCTLKLSLINKLFLTNDTTAPYLENQIRVSGSNPSIPYPRAILEAEGYTSGFRKNISKSVLQQTTTNETTDFTIFQ